MNPLNPSGSPDPIPPSPVWPPPPTDTNPYNQVEENTSGQNSSVPPEIAALKWNWGAFLLSFLWSINHKIAWGWAILVLGGASRLPTIGPLFSIVNFGLAIYLGLNGHKLGWQHRRFDGGLPQYFEVQQKWLYWGVGVLIFGFVVGVAAGVMGGLAAAHR